MTAGHHSRQAQERKSGPKPPHSVEAEREVLSVVLLYPERIRDVRALLRPEDFYLERHQAVLRVMQALDDAEVPIDLVTLRHGLVEHGVFERVGGARCISELLERSGVAIHLPHYAHIVKRLAYKRRIIAEAEAIFVDMHSDEDEAAERVERRIAAIGGFYADLQSVGTKRRTWKDAVAESVLRGMGQGTKRRRHGFGISVLDERLNGGVADGALVVINALSGGGKTALGVNNFAIQCAKAGERVFIASLEMGDDELAERALARETGLEPWRFDQGAVFFNRYADVNAAGDELMKLDIVVEEQCATIDEIVARALSAHEEKPVDAVVIDYAQLIDNGIEGEANLAKTSRRAKLLAKKLGCPVVLLVQSTLAVNRAKTAPDAADAKGTQAFQADADVIIVPHILEPEGQERPDVCEAEIHVRKQRKGKRGKVSGLVYDGPRCVFREVVAV